MAVGDIGRRIKAARGRLGGEGVTQEWLAERLGITQPRLSNWERGEHDPPRDLVVAAARVLEVDLGWLEFGTTAHVDRPRFVASYAMVDMRFAGDVPTGEWGDPLASEEPIEMEAKFDGAKRFVARVVGDSCFPALQQGDLTVWHQDFAPPYGKIVLAQRKGDHGCTVKQLAYDASESRPVLRPVNPHHTSPPDGEGWGAIARLVGVVFKVSGAEFSIYKPEGVTPSDLGWRGSMER